MPGKDVIKTNKTLRRAYDWNMIETDYVTDYTQTYETLGEKYGPRPKAISRQAIKRNWREKRKEFERKKAIKIQEKLAEIKAQEEADEIARMNKAHYDSQQGLKYLADKIIVEDVERIKGGNTGELSARQIQTLANANKIVQESQRLAKGLTDKELNINLIHNQIMPILEKIVIIIENHAPQTKETIIREFTALFGTDIPGCS